MSQVSNQLDEGACIFGASILLNHVEALIKETAGVHAGEEDIEFIHRARVASRRLRAALPLFQSCLPSRKSSTWLKSIRNVTRALGEARDADVQIECVEAVLSQVTDEAYRPGIRRLLLRLRQKRAGLQPSVVSAMGSLIDAGILDQMRERFAAQAARKDSVYIYTPALYQHSFQSIVTRLDNLLSYDAIVAQPEKVTELHEMRICAKWLRYNHGEFFYPICRGAKTLSTNRAQSPGNAGGYPRLRHVGRIITTLHRRGATAYAGLLRSPALLQAPYPRARILPGEPAPGARSAVP